MLAEDAMVVAAGVVERVHARLGRGRGERLRLGERPARADGAEDAARENLGKIAPLHELFCGPIPPMHI